MAQVLMLAAAAAVYPALLAGVILILTRPRPLPQLAAFYAGGLTISVASGLALLLALDETGVSRGAGRTVSPAVDIAAGTLTLIVAARLWKRPVPAAPRHRVPGRLSRTLARGSVPLAAAVGVILNLPSVWYLAALKDIDAGDHSAGQSVLMVLAFNVVMFALVEIPLVWYLLSPAGAERAVNRFDAWFHAHSRTIAAVVATALGPYLLVKGIVQL